MTRPDFYRFRQGDRVLPFDASEYEARLAGLRQIMAEAGVDGFPLEITYFADNPIHAAYAPLLQAAYGQQLRSANNLGAAASAIGRSGFIPFDEKKGCFAESFTRSFISLNLSQYPESLIESELFGHEAGAFTGAQRLRKGRFEMAEEGTLFLDEIGTMPMIVQEKILRAIEYRTFERVGGSSPLSVDVRIIAATNRDIRAMVADGSFRQDLYYRLNVVHLAFPPLRERPADILHIVGRYLDQTYKVKKVITPSARAALTTSSGLVLLASGRPPAHI